MDKAINAWSIILRTIVPALIAFLVGVVTVLGFNGIFARAGFILVVDGAIWTSLQTIVFFRLRAEAKEIFTQAQMMGGPLEVLMLDRLRPELSWIYGRLFNIITSVFAGIAVGAFAISLAAWPTGLEDFIKHLAQNRFIFSSTIILPISLVATYLGVALTDTERNLPNYATVFAAIFGTFIALYAMPNAAP